jgi:hypothetical protein
MTKGKWYLLINYEISPEQVRWIFYFKYFAIARFKIKFTEDVVTRFL